MKILRKAIILFFLLVAPIIIVDSCKPLGTVWEVTRVVTDTTIINNDTIVSRKIVEEPKDNLVDVRKLPIIVNIALVIVYIILITR